MRYHFHSNPDELDDDEWAKQWGELEWALNFLKEEKNNG
jgi:hypothetical protein